MKLSLRRPIHEVSEYCGISTTTIVHFVEEEWISPIDNEMKMFDE